MSTAEGTGARVAIGVVAIAVIAAGIWFWQRPAPIAPGILFVGDSVTYMSAQELDQELRSDHPKVLARVGYRSADMAPLFKAEVARRAKEHDQLRQVAILLGYNDVLQHQAANPALADVMALANRFECAVWLTLPQVPLREREVTLWNQRVDDTARSYPHVHVVDDWSKAVEGAAPDEHLLGKDGVHPTRAGAQRLSEIYTEAVHRVC